MLQHVCPLIGELDVCDVELRCQIGPDVMLQPEKKTKKKEEE